jgi:hypothetical protein
MTRGLIQQLTIWVCAADVWSRRQVLAMQSFATVGNSVTARAFQGGGMRAARRVADRLLVFGVVASTTLAASTWLAREHLPRLFTSDMACNLACQPAFLPVCLMVSAHASHPSGLARCSHPLGSHHTLRRPRSTTWDDVC